MAQFFIQPINKLDGRIPKLSDFSDMTNELLYVMYHFFHLKVPYTDYVTECEEGYEEPCEEQWVCRDDPKPESLKYCKNKQWEATDECVKIKVDNCKDVQKTFHK